VIIPVNGGLVHGKCGRGGANNIGKVTNYNLDEAK
jgi:hypothetical protein